MEPCDVCEKELGSDYRTVDIHRTHLIKRGVNKGKLGGTSVASEYGKFEPVSVKVCSRHLRGFYTQRLIPGFIAFILLFIPVLFLVKLIPIWSDTNRTPLVLTTIIIVLAVVYFLVRRITYDGYIASVLTLQPRNREAKIEYFGQAKYRRMMKNFSKLDAILKDDNQK